MGEAFNGSAVIAVNGTETVAVRAVNYGHGGRRVFSSNAFAGSHAGPVVNCPGLIGNSPRAGDDSLLAIQNLGSTATDVKVHYYTPDGTRVHSSSHTALPAMYRLLLKPRKLPENYTGSARVVSGGQPIVATVFSSDQRSGYNCAQP